MTYYELPSIDNAAQQLYSPYVLECEEQFEIVPPQEHSSRLSFQALYNGVPIAYARLRKEEIDQRYDKRVIQLFSARRAPTYHLKMIQVAQNYRNRGIGSILLKEIIHYCKHHNIDRIVGDIQGDVEALQRFYQENGFTVHPNHSIEIKLGNPL